MTGGLQRALEAIAGPGSVSSRPVTDLWPLGLMRARAGHAVPAVTVVRPSSYEAVAAVLVEARGRGLPVLPVGAATGVLGAATAEAGTVALDLTALDRILQVDPFNLTCRVQAGVVGLTLERELAGRDLTLGHVPSSLPFSTIGGLISTRSSGQQSSRYGGIEDLVCGLTVAMPDGRILEPLPGPRSAAGPALHQLFVGAEGTLGVVLDSVLRIARVPATVIGGGWGVPDVESGLAAMREIMQAGLRPLVMRLYDAEDTAFQGAGIEGCLLVLAFGGEPEVAGAESAVAGRVLAGARSLGPEPWERWRRHRFDLSDARLRDFLAPPGSLVDTIEVAAPWSALPALHAEIKAVLSDAGLALCHFSHAYPQGCCAYFSFAGSRDSEAEAEAALRRSWSGAMEACLRAGAAMTHHHGIGQARAPWVRRELGGWWQVWQEVRAALDPAGTMNPLGMGGH